MFSNPQSLLKFVARNEKEKGKKLSRGRGAETGGVGETGRWECFPQVIG